MQKKKKKLRHEYMVNGDSCRIILTVIFSTFGNDTRSLKLNCKLCML